MKPGDLIALKPDYRPEARMLNPTVFLILDQASPQARRYLEVLDRSGTVINIPLSSVFAYEVVNEAG